MTQRRIPHATSPTEVRQAFQRLDSVVDTQDSRLTAAEADIESLQSEVTTLDGRLDTAESNIATLQSSVSTLQADLDAAEADIATLQSDLDAAEADIDTLQSDVTTLDGRMDAAEADIDTLDARTDGLTSGRIVYVTTGGALADSAYMMFDGTRPTFSAGAKFGYSAAAYWTGPNLHNFVIQRRGDLNEFLMLDYQDTLAYMHKKGTVSITPTPNNGSIDNLFIDDSTYLTYSTSSTAGTVVIEVLPTTAIPYSAAVVWWLGLTFRSSSGSANPTHIKVEVSLTTSGSYYTAYEGDIPATGSLDEYITPSFSTASPYTIGKLKVTLTIPNPLPSNFRLQRMLLYHTTGAWDPWHIHIGGGTVYGAIVAGAGTDLTLTHAAGKNISLSGQKFPNANGQTGNVLMTNGAGELYWGELVTGSTSDSYTYTLSNQTTDDTPTELFIDGPGGSERLTIDEETSWYFEIRCVAREPGGDYTTNGWYIEGMIGRDSGGNATILNQDALESFLNDMDWAFAVSADTTNQSLKLTVTGESGQTINWMASVKLLAVTEDWSTPPEGYGNNPYLLLNSTTDGTPTELFLDGIGGSERLEVPEGASWFFEIECIGREKGGAHKTNGYHVEGMIGRDIESDVAILNQDTLESWENDTDWAFAVSADIANQSLKLEVTGEASVEINWMARVTLTTVSAN